MYLDTLKALQALEVIRRAHLQDAVSSPRLLMLLYLCECESWRVRSQPLLESSIVATKATGPVHSVANSIVHDSPPRDGSPKELAESDILILQRITKLHMGKSESELLTLTTALPNWDNRSRHSWGSEIPYTVILESLGFQADQISELLANYPALTTESD